MTTEETNPTLNELLNQTFPGDHEKRGYRVQVIEDTCGFIDGTEDGFPYHTIPDHKGGAIIDLYECGQRWVIKFHPKPFKCGDGAEHILIQEPSEFIYMNDVYPTCKRCGIELSFHVPDLDDGMLTIVCKCGLITKVYSETDMYTP